MVVRKWGKEEELPFLCDCVGWERQKEPAFRCGVGSHSKSFRRQSSQHSSLQLPFLFWGILRSLCSPIPHSPQSPIPHTALLCGSLSRFQVPFFFYSINFLSFCNGVLRFLLWSISSSTLCALHHFELETMRWGAAKFWYIRSWTYIFVTIGLKICALMALRHVIYLTLFLQRNSSSTFPVNQNASRLISLGIVLMLLLYWFCVVSLVVFVAY